MEGLLLQTLLFFNAIDCKDKMKGHMHRDAVTLEYV